MSAQSPHCIIEVDNTGMTEPASTLGGSISNASIMISSAILGTSTNPIDVDTLIELGDKGNPIVLF